jgi:hypothetical protein
MAPPTDLSLLVTTPTGHSFRWAEDEANASYIPSGLSFASGAVGGHESLNVVLPRRTNVDYPDLPLLSDIKVIGNAKDVAWQGRLEATPRASGDSSTVGPLARGYQYSLEDDKSAVGMYVNRNLTDWQAASGERKLILYNSGAADVIVDGQAEANETTGVPQIKLPANGRWATGHRSQRWFDAGPGGLVSSVSADYTYRALTASYNARVVGFDNDDGSVAGFAGTDVVTGASGSGSLSETISPQARYVAFYMFLNAASTADGDRDIVYSNVVVTGNQGLASMTAGAIIADIVDRWAPQLDYTTGDDGTIIDTQFVIPHFSFREPTTAAEMVRAANRFELLDWAVWGTTFYLQPRSSGREWRARIAPAQLEEAGEQVDRLWNGVIVRYRDVSGATMTVGPVGSGANTETEEVEDADDLSPVNQLGIRRWTTLDMQGTSTVAGATEVGRRFIEESKVINTSGRAQLVGHVEDTRGVLWPAWAVRGGDTISFVDANDHSPRRIVKTNYTHDNRTCSVDLDAPPEGLAELLDRLQVVLVPLGL